MLLTILFLSIFIIGTFLTFLRGPIWGLIVYASVYFLAPNPNINWWAQNIPDLRWSLLTAVILMASFILHKNTQPKHKLGIIYFFVLIMLVLIELLTHSIAVSPVIANYYAYNMIGYCLIIFLIVKTLSTHNDLRLFILAIIVFNALLGLQGILEGEFFSGRLNNIGPADAHSSNEFGLLLSSVFPFLIPFLMKGKKYEKIICFICLPFIVDGFTLTVSRGAVISLFASVLYAFFVLADKKMRKNILVTVMFLIPFFLLFIDKSYQDRISSLWTADRTNEQAVSDLSSGRISLWEHSLSMVSDYPWGTGPGGFREISRFYMPEKLLSYHSNHEYGVKAAHNTYLLVLVELGYIGFLCFMTLCSTILYKLYRSLKKLRINGDNDTFFSILIISISMSLIATLVGGLVGSSYYYEFFWWQIAIAIVGISFAGREDHNVCEHPSA